MDENSQLFNDFVKWLDPDRDLGPERYEVTRRGLIRMFIANGIDDGAELADETFNRVLTKFPEIRDTYIGDPVRYLYGVARNVLREARRRKEIVTDEVPEQVVPPPLPNPRTDCLRQCLKLFSQDNQELIIDYHAYQGRDKIEQHRIMASELSISEGALRSRAHKLRAELEKCVFSCMGYTGKNERQ